MSQRISLLAKAELFSGLDRSIRAHMASIALPRHYAPRDVIFAAGDVIRGVLLLTEGRVKLTRFSEEGAEVILRLCVPGHVVYPSAVVPEEMYYSTAETLQACHVLAWDAKNFHTAQGLFPPSEAMQNACLKARYENSNSAIVRRAQKKFRRAWRFVYFIS